MMRRRAFWGRFCVCEDNPGQSLLVVDRADGQSPLLIPLVDEFLVGIDEERERIDVDAPAGLLSL